MIFDAKLLFSNAVTLNTSTSTASSVIALSAARDLGMGDGLQPKVFGVVGTAFRSACASATFTVNFEGSTDSTNWTTYSSVPGQTTTSLVSSSVAFQFDVPPRPMGVALPSYYRLNYVVGGNTSELLSGSLTAGIIQQPAESPRTIGLYASGYTVA